MRLIDGTCWSLHDTTITNTVVIRVSQYLCTQHLHHVQPPLIMHLSLVIRNTGVYTFSSDVHMKVQEKGLGTPFCLVGLYCSVMAFFLPCFHHMHGPYVLIVMPPFLVRV